MIITYKKCFQCYEFVKISVDIIETYSALNLDSGSISNACMRAGTYPH